MNEIRPGSHARAIDVNLLIVAGAIVTRYRVNGASWSNIDLCLRADPDEIRVQITLHPAMTVLDVIEQVALSLRDQTGPLPPVAEIVLHDGAGIEIVMADGQQRVVDLPSVSARAGAEGELPEFLRRLPRVLAAAPEEFIARLDILDPAERQILLHQWNGAARPVAASTFAELFAAQAARTPDAVALLCEGHPALTYAQLDRRANKVAHHLQGLGIVAESLVGLCLERGPEMIVALLGILKAGAAYLPLDPAYPEARLAHMVEDAGAKILISDLALVERLPALAGRSVVLLDAEAERIARCPETAPATTATPANLAYVIYTSGSTGSPKGVVAAPITGIPSMALAHAESLGITSRSRVLQFSSMSFDAMVWEVAAAFLVGRGARLDDAGPAPWRAGRGCHPRAGV